MLLMTASPASRCGGAFCVLLATLLAPVAVWAQTNSGALDLLKPIGARPTAMGAAYVAEQGGEAVWWNPAGIARVTKPEFALDHFQDVFVASGDAASIILPAGIAGVFGIEARLFNFDTIRVTTLTGEDVGLTTPRSISLGATYAASFGPQLSAGLSLRFYQFNVACSGACATLFAADSYTGYLDAGVQFRPTPSGPLQVGVVLSNLGPNLQVHDQPQADALPARLHVGASYRPTSTAWDPALSLAATAELVSSLALSSKELHVGTEVGYASGITHVFARAGFVLQAQGADGQRNTGPSVGVGIASGRVTIDFARVIEAVSTGLGVPPTYISIRLGL